jgi:DNA-binding transcriptional ArsR family regulator
MKAGEEQIVKIAKALADKSRVRIVQEIARRGSVTCGDAVDIACLSQPTVSHHVKVLIDAGILLAVKEGRHVMITVNKDVLKEFAVLLTASAA